MSAQVRPAFPDNLPQHPARGAALLCQWPLSPRLSARPRAGARAWPRCCCRRVTIRSCMHEDRRRTATGVSSRSNRDDPMLASAARAARLRRQPWSRPRSMASSSPRQRAPAPRLRTAIGSKCWRRCRGAECMRLALRCLKLRSRLLLGTSRYPSPADSGRGGARRAGRAVTVSLRREASSELAGQGFWSLIRELGVRVLPNTAGCHTRQGSGDDGAHGARSVCDPLDQARGDRRGRYAAARRLRLVEAARVLTPRAFRCCLTAPRISWWPSGCSMPAAAC